MKFSSAASIAFAAGASAFPQYGLEKLQGRAASALPVIEARAGGSASGVPFPPDPAQLTGTFDAKAQYVSNTGKYAFVEPTSSDSRGPCPGLNAMANHGYIPHNGVATIQQFIDGTYNVFGMGKDLGGFLAVYGALEDGDLTKWSIGGPNPTVGLGATGLIGSHNRYEADASPVRPDLYEYGNNYKIQWDQWKALYNKQAGVSAEDANYNLGILQEFRSERFDQSIANNPYFFNGAFSGVAVQPAAYTFIYRFMANKSAEHPDGVLNKDVLKSFYGVQENSDGSFTAIPERIPDNWYKRAIGDEYTIPFFILDLVYEASVYPKFLDIGGNTGKTNTFTGVDVENLTGGVFNGANLAQGNNAFCFAYQVAQNSLVPIDALQALGGTLTGILAKLAPDAAKAISNLGCPQLAGIEESMLEQFPGYTRSLSN